MRTLLTLSLLLWLHSIGYAQTYNPIPLTGYNVDAFAETAPNSLTTTSASLDLTNHVMYTQSFATATGLSAGVVDNGYINYTSGSIIKNFQIAPYTSLNALAVPVGVSNKLLTATTPASYSKLSLLLFSTEASCDVSITVKFTDGSIYLAGSSTVQDWFNGSNAVYSSFGRCIRTASGPYNVDGLPSNPRFYNLDIALPCIYQKKLLQSVAFSWINGTTNNSTAYILSLSGVSYTIPVITPTITNATCAQNNGSIALSVTGGTYSYSWNTTPVQTSATATNLTAGNYSCTITDANSCTVLYYGSLTSQPGAMLTAAANPSTICTNTNSSLSATVTGGTISNYSWTPGALTGNTVTVSPSANTTYRVTGQDNFGCLDTAYVTVNVKTTPTSNFTASPDPSCMGDTIAVNYTGNASPLASYTWNFAGANTISGNNAGPYKISYTNAASPSVTLTVTDNGCTSATSQQMLNIKPRYTSSFSVSSDSICSGNTVTIAYTGNGNAAAAYNWNFGNGTIQQGSGQGPYVISFANNTDPYLSLNVSANGCASNTSLDTIVVISKPVALFAASPVSGCDSIITNFSNNSQNALRYSWTFGDGNASTTPAPVHKYFNGSYNVQLIAINYFCYDTLLINNYIQVKPTYSASFIMSKDSICSGGSISVNYSGNALSNATYNWNFGNGNISQGSGQGPYVISFSNNSNPYISLTVDNAGCTSPPYKDTIAVIAQPVAAFTANPLTACKTLEVTFTNNSQNSSSYFWSFADGSFSSATSPVHVYLPGSYKPKLISGNHFCYDTLTFTDVIKVNPQPVASFTSTPLQGTILPVSTASFSFMNTSSAADNYKWFFGDGDSSIVANPLHHYGSVGSFTVTLMAINTAGCTDTFIVQPYIVIADSVIKIPNAFSPNGDGINDTWVINGLTGQKKAVVEVYDRWGKIIYRSSGNYIPWDGRHKGQNVPVGIYYYLINVDANQKPLSGWLYLTR
jgi:gliding motility-associated-like protein